ncbi:MAG: ATP-binding protein, partial [Bdellovibrionia bacterium]
RGFLNITYAGLLWLGLAGTLTAIAVVTLSTKLLISSISTAVIDKEVEILFGSIEAGPVAFARLHSAAYSDEQLKRLMSNSRLNDRGITEVVISGGEEQNFKYANWKTNTSVAPGCLSSRQREFSYPDSMYPFRVTIYQDSCFLVEERKIISKYATYSGAALSFVFLFLLAIIFWPTIRSIALAEGFVGQRFNGEPTLIPLVPIRRLFERARQVAEFERDAAFSRTAAQVAHDIRAPLAALNAVIFDSQAVDESIRAQLQTAATRIRNIADGLLKKKRDSSEISPVASSATTPLPSDATEEAKTVELLAAHLDSVVTQARLQYQDRPDLEISLNLTGEEFGLFAEIKVTEFYRVLSNLINNSAEALGEKGHIQVSLTRSNERAQVRVIDNGKGIPSELLSKVVLPGGTFGKVNGNGLGLSHAKSTTESWGGVFKLESTVGVGTTVTLEFALCDSPQWFPQATTIAPTSTIVVIDDDPSVHQIWDGKVLPFTGHGKDQPKVVHLYTAQELLSWYRENLSLENVFYFCDYSFSSRSQTGQTPNGLDLIEMTGVRESAVLVTHRWDDEELRQRCEKLGQKLLPKFLLNQLPLHTHVQSAESALASTL